MNKEADILESVKGMAGKVAPSIFGAAKDPSVGQRISDWYTRLDPNIKSTALSGLAGAAVGGGLAGGLAAATPEDPERKRSILGPALLGALLGGGAGAALPAGVKLLTGDMRLGREARKPLMSRATDAVVDPVINNAIPIAATAVGYNRSADSYKALGDMMTTQRDAARGVQGVTDVKAPVLKRLREALGSRDMWKVKRDLHGVQDAAGTLRYGKKTLALLPLSLLAGLALKKYVEGKY